MKKIYLLVLLIVSLFVLQSCYTRKPLGKVTTPDYNQRVSVTNAQIKKKSNAVNVVFKVSVTGLGGFIGYKYIPIEVEGRSMPVMGGILGAAGGLSLSYLADAIMGRGKIKPVKNPTLWINRSGKDYNLKSYKLLSGSGQNFTIMHPSVEMNYTVRNIQDVRDFKKMFPYSNYTDAVYQRAIMYLPRNDLPELLILYPDNIHSDEAKTAYIKKSLSYNEVLAAARKYPIDGVDRICASLVTTPDDAISFLDRYPTSMFEQTAVINAFKKNEPSQQDMQKLKNSCGDLIYLTQFNHFVDDATILKNYFGGMCNLTNPSTFEQFYDFTEKYEWTNFPNKKQTILSKYWDMNDKIYTDGFDVIWYFKTILIEPQFAKYNISESDIKEVMKAKFQSEVEKNVVIVSERCIGKNTPEWENWKRSRYTAGIVQEYDQVNYIVYGEIYNGSKFNLSVALHAAGTLQETKSIKGQGGLGALAALLGITAESKNDIAGEQGVCYLPVIPAGEKEIYAVLLDFGVRLKNQGVNVLDIVKYESEIRIRETKTAVRYSEDRPSRYQLEQQEEWRAIVHSGGLPSGKLTDLVRGEEVRQNIWEMRKEKLDEERRERAIRIAKKIEREREIDRAIDRLIERLED